MRTRSLRLLYRWSLPVFIVAVCSMTTAPAQGQAPKSRAVADPALAPGSWSKFSVFHMADAALKADDFRAVSATLQRVHEVFTHVEPLNPPPKGALMEPNVTVGVTPFWTREEFPFRRDVVPASYTIFFLHPTLVCPQGNCKVDKGEGPALHLYINTPHDAIEGNRPLWGDHRKPDSIYTAPQQIGTVAGFPLYENDRVVITKRKQPLWVPLTQEEYIRRAIQDWQQKEADTRKDLVKRGIADPQAPPFSQLFENFSRTIATLQKELAAIPSAERSATAYFGSNSEHLSFLSSSSDSQARMVVRFNKDFFDPQLPANAIQLIILKTDLAWTDAEYEKRKSSNGRTAVENNEIFHQLIKKLDWTALLGLLQ